MEAHLRVLIQAQLSQCTRGAVRALVRFTRVGGGGVGGGYLRREGDGARGVVGVRVLGVVWRVLGVGLVGVGRRV